MPRRDLYCVVFGSLFALIVGCSTPISPYSALDDEDGEEDDPTPTVDAGPSPRDAGTRDAGGTSDASVPGGADCTRLPTAVFGSLFDEGCATRATLSCAARGQTEQQVVNQRFATIAKECGASSNATLGFSFGPGGCAEQFGYSDPSLLGKVSQCIQLALENVRFSCSLRCALIGPGAR